MIRQKKPVVNRCFDTITSIRAFYQESEKVINQKSKPEPREYDHEY